MKRQQTFNIKGMTRDISPSKSNGEYAYDIKNMRLAAQEGETTLSLVNEKGNKQYTVNIDNSTLKGTIIGYCVIDNLLTLFTHEDKPTNDDKADNIYRLSIVKDSNTLTGTRLYNGDLGFKDGIVLETLGIFESENIKKVYWIDGIHQPRFINIAADDDTRRMWKRQETPFDFIAVYDSKESVSIAKTDYSGAFPAGTIQYAMSYYNLNGQQTNIFYVSPLYYTSHGNRGAAADETVSNSFSITIDNADCNFDYLRIYRIMRTTANDNADCRILQDIPITRQESFDSNGNAVYRASKITLTDTGIFGTSVDPFEILYAGGREIIPECMAQKDNTLFLGNFSVKNNLFPQTSADALKKIADTNLSYYYGNSINKGTQGSLYMYENQLQKNSQQITTFKGGETYRFGLVFQNDKGEWSNVVYLTDKHNNLYPDDDIEQFKPVKGEFTIPKDVVQSIIDEGYRKVKGVVVYPTYADREVLCQGVLCPTVYTIADRKDNRPYAASSWFFRDIHVYDSLNYGHLDYAVQNRHNYNISSMHEGTGVTCLKDSEIYGASPEDISAMNPQAEGNAMDVFVDWNVVTLNTPELDFSDAVFPTNGLKMRIVGAIPITSGACDITINTSTAPRDSTIKNFKRNIFQHQNLSSLGCHVRLSDFDWYDKPYNKNVDIEGLDENATYWQYPIFPWHRSASLIDQIVSSDTDNWISELNTKILSNIRTSALTLFLSPEKSKSYNISDIGVYNGSNALARLSKDDNDNEFDKSFNYYGEVDTTLLRTGQSGYKTLALQNNKLGKSKKLASDGVRIKYRSSPHIAFQLRYTSDHKQTILPSLSIGSVSLGKQSNPVGMPHWSKDYNSNTETDTEKENESNNSVIANAESIKARILKDSEGNIIDGKWVKEHSKLVVIDNINSSNFPYGWVDMDFLKSYAANETPPATGDVILFPNVTTWNSNQNLDTKETKWQDTPILYRIISTNTTDSQAESGQSYQLKAMGNTKDYKTVEFNAIGFWKYRDKAEKNTYVYEVFGSYKDGNVTKTDSYPGAVLRQIVKDSVTDDGINSNLTSSRTINAVIDKYSDGSIIDDTWIDNHKDLVVLGKEMPITEFIDGQDEVVGWEPSGNFISKDLLAGIIDYPAVGNVILFLHSNKGYNTWDKGNTTDTEGPIFYKITGISNNKCELYPCDMEYAGWWNYDLKNGYFDLYYASVTGWAYYPIVRFKDKVTKYSDGGSTIDGGYLSQDTIDLSSNSHASQFARTASTTYGFLYIGELYRNINADSLFGGKTDSALQGNQWNVAGKAVDLTSDKDVVVPFDQGDTYYQRYDCLKTYPYTNQDPNQIVEILSFMCETRINIDGRYDTQRGQSSNLNMRPENFNLLNKVYTQNDNFFGNSYLDYRRNKVNTFRNSILWSKTKTLGEDVDSWTNIQQTSILDLDGDKGKVNALKNFNDSLLSFQDNGIARILYNERVQVNASDGVPIEIANSGKVQGKQYISDHIGCTNKRTIQATSRGLYFMDSNSKDIYTLGENIQSLSKAKGFNSWLYNRDFSKYRTFFDEKASDIYFIDDTSCLVYSEQLGEFTGFYSYENTDFMFNLDDHFIAIKDNSLWHQFAGDYNYFFGSDKINYQPFYVTVIANQGLNDKIFGTVDFLADSWDTQNGILNETFDSLSAWNEYQLGYSNLKKINDNKKYYWSNLKRKFRIWRADIPRAMYISPTIDINGITKVVDSIEAKEGDTTGISAGYSVKKSIDRIRSTWAYVKLSMQKENKHKTVLHNLTVNYYN